MINSVKSTADQSNRLELTAELTKLCTAFRVPRTALIESFTDTRFEQLRPFKPWTDDEKEGLRKLVGLVERQGYRQDAWVAVLCHQEPAFQMEVSAQLTEGYTVRQLQLLLGVPNRSIQIWLTTKAS